MPSLIKHAVANPVHVCGVVGLESLFVLCLALESDPFAFFLVFWPQSSTEARNLIYIAQLVTELLHPVNLTTRIIVVNKLRKGEGARANRAKRS